MPSLAYAYDKASRVNCCDVRYGKYAFLALFALFALVRYYYKVAVEFDDRMAYVVRCVRTNICACVCIFVCFVLWLLPRSILLLCGVVGRVNTFRRNDLLKGFVEHYTHCPEIETIVEVWRSEERRVGKECVSKCKYRW